MRVFPTELAGGEEGDGECDGVGECCSKALVPGY